jgi:hypothetical protein
LPSVALQMPLSDEPEKPAHPLVPEETGAREDAFQLAARRINICTREGHAFENTSYFHGRANV